MSARENEYLRYCEVCIAHNHMPVPFKLFDVKGWLESEKCLALGKPLRGYTSDERKALPIQKLLAEYFPDAIAAVARHSLKANEKHNPGEPMHWARKKSTDHLNCAVRHLMTPDAVDPDTGEIELVGAAWRCLAALQLREEARLAAAGIMPLSGQTPL